MTIAAHHSNEYLTLILVGLKTCYSWLFLGGGYITVDVQVGNIEERNVTKLGNVYNNSPQE